MKPSVICLMGPTASGKTQAALYLADKLPLHIISVDSALIYREMNIGTAKPDQETLKRYPHALVDICAPTTRYSAENFRIDARKEIDYALAQNKIPLLVGGTFLYFKTLLEGISPVPQTNPEVQQALMQVLDHKGLAHLYMELKIVDPQSAARLSPNDTQRILRALEVYHSSGKTLSHYWTLPKKAALSYPTIKLALASEQIATRNAQIRQRFLTMIDAGFIDEVKALRAHYPELNEHYPSQRAVGYRQLWDYLAGKSSKAEAIERGIIATRQYAKRQRTWLRSETELTAIDIDQPKAQQTLITVIEQFLASPQ